MSAMDRKRSSIPKIQDDRCRKVSTSATIFVGQNGEDATQMLAKTFLRQVAYFKMEMLNGF